LFAGTVKIRSNVIHRVAYRHATPDCIGTNLFGSFSSEPWRSIFVGTRQAVSANKFGRDSNQFAKCPFDR
jgi:hypothetical protein